MRQVRLNAEVALAPFAEQFVAGIPGGESGDDGLLAAMFGTVSVCSVQVGDRIIKMKAMEFRSDLASDGGRRFIPLKADSF